MNRTWTLAAVALGVALPAALAGAADQKDLNAAVKAFEKKDYARVLEIAATFDDDDALRPKALYLAGEAHLAGGDWDEAAAAFEAVVEVREEAVPALVGLGRARLGSGDVDGAREVLDKALAAAPKDGPAHRTLGDVLLKKQDYAGAEKHYIAAFRADAKDVLAYRGIVELKLAAGDLKQARGYAEAAVVKMKKEPMAWFLKGLVLDRLGKVKDAIAAYEKAVALDDTFIDGHKNLAILCVSESNTYQDTKRVQKAFKHINRYFELGGEDTELKGIYDTIKGYLEQAGVPLGE